MTTANEYERRDANDRAEIDHRASDRARLSGIPHYVLSNASESWVAGQGARNEFWADLPSAASFDAEGRKTG